MKKDSLKDCNIKKTPISSEKIIPDSELWLYQNVEALASFNQGLKEAAEGKLTRINLREF
jgi:hypothetical protein